MSKVFNPVVTVAGKEGNREFHLKDYAQYAEFEYGYDKALKELTNPKVTLDMGEFTHFPSFIRGTKINEDIKELLKWRTEDIKVADTYFRLFGDERFKGETMKDTLMYIKELFVGKYSSPYEWAAKFLDLFIEPEADNIHPYIYYNLDSRTLWNIFLSKHFVYDKKTGYVFDNG